MKRKFWKNLLQSKAFPRRGEHRRILEDTGKNLILRRIAEEKKDESHKSDHSTAGDRKEEQKSEHAPSEEQKNGHTSEQMLSEEKKQESKSESILSEGKKV